MEFAPPMVTVCFLMIHGVLQQVLTTASTRKGQSAHFVHCRSVCMEVHTRARRLARATEPCASEHNARQISISHAATQLPGHQFRVDACSILK